MNVGCGRGVVDQRDSKALTEQTHRYWLSVRLFTSPNHGLHATIREDVSEVEEHFFPRVGNIYQDSKSYYPTIGNSWQLFHTSTCQTSSTLMPGVGMARNNFPISVYLMKGNTRHLKTKQTHRGK